MPEAIKTLNHDLSEPDLAAVHRAGSVYRLTIPRGPISGGMGEMMGASSGSSLEFHDFREYVPGDDVRHIDWSALGRSDQLMIRLYREEVAPFADILLDGSRSMSVGEGCKGKLARELALAFELFAGKAGAGPELWLVGDRPRRLEGAAEQMARQMTLESRHSLDRPDEWRQLCLRRRSIRVVVSDFLFVHEADTLVKQLAAGASALWLIQVLDKAEASPEIGGGVRLVDAETQEFDDVILNEKIVGDYVKRLANLQAALTRACRRASAQFVPLVAGRSLDDVCRSSLLRAGAIMAE